jgi:hypothetical protein
MVAAIRAILAEDPSPISQSASLTNQTRSLLRTFDSENHDQAFEDSGLGARYARWLADMLDCWLVRYGDDISV